MHSGDNRLVRQMQLVLAGSHLDGEDAGQLSFAVAHLQDRVRRLHRLGDGFASVRLSGYVAGLRAVSVLDRVGGVASPRMA